MLTHEDLRELCATLDCLANQDEEENDDKAQALRRAKARVTPATAQGFQVQLLTAQRPGETQKMRWADVDLESAREPRNVGRGKATMLQVVEQCRWLRDLPSQDAELFTALMPCPGTNFQRHDDAVRRERWSRRISLPIHYGAGEASSGYPYKLRFHQAAHALPTL